MNNAVKEVAKVIEKPLEQAINKVYVPKRKGPTKETSEVNMLGTKDSVVVSKPLFV